MLQQKLLNIFATVEKILFVAESEDLFGLLLPATTEVMSQRVTSDRTHAHFVVVLRLTVLPVDLGLRKIRHNYVVIHEDFLTLLVIIDQSSNVDEVRVC